MRKSTAILIVVFILMLTVGCNSKTIASCNYDINFVEYTDKPNFVEMMKGKIPLVPMEWEDIEDMNDGYPLSQEVILASENLITIKLNRKPKEINLREYWVDDDGNFNNGASGPYTTTGSYAIDGKTVYLPVIYRINYVFHNIGHIINKAFEMVITFEDGTVEKYAFITKSQT